MRLYYDLHIHSALSPCGDADMTPNNIVNMSKLNGLDIIAVADHNTCRNAPAISAVAKREGIVFLPAMELETAEEIHVLCLFAELEAARAFEDQIVAPNLPPVKNNERIFGVQQLLDENDDAVGTDDRYLLNAVSVTVDFALKRVVEYGGIAVPAHIDKQTKSLMSVFGSVDAQLGARVLELSRNAPSDYAVSQPSLEKSDFFYIHDSDAHYLFDIFERGEKNFIEIDGGNPTAADVIRFLKSK